MAGSRYLSDLLGTLKTTFRIGKAVIDTSGTGSVATVLYTTTNGIRSKSYHPTVQTPSFSATPTIDPSLGSTVDMTLTGNVTACTVSAGENGDKLTLRIKQDGTGSRTWVFDSSVAFGTDITGITLTTTANKTDLIGLEYNATAAKWWVVAFTKGF